MSDLAYQQCRFTQYVLVLSLRNGGLVSDAEWDYIHAEAARLGLPLLTTDFATTRPQGDADEDTA